MTNKILDKINEYKNICIYRHNRPDWDALGSQFGLKEIIQDNFIGKNVVLFGDNPNNNIIYPYIEETIINEPFLAIVLDCNTVNLISSDTYKNADYLIQIDHHVSKGGFGDISYIDSNIDSVCSLLTELALENNLAISSKAATYLIGGIITDSGRFKYPSVTSKTFIRIAKLIDLGGDYRFIMDNYNNEDIKSVKLRGYFLDNFIDTKKGVAYMKNSKEIFDKFDVSVFKVSRGMVNSMSGIDGIEIWANFTEDVEFGGILAELRSKKKAINHIARKYGGGGHELACGATINSWDEVDMIISDLIEVANNI